MIPAVPRAPRQRRTAGFSLLELVIVIGLVAVLATVAADRLTRMRGAAEKAAVESIIGAIRSAFGIRFAELIAKGRSAEIPQLVRTNPFELLADMPETYRGAFFGVDAGLFAPGDWYYDRRDNKLVYLAKFTDPPANSASGPNRVRLAPTLIFDDLNGNDRFDVGIDKPTGIKFGIVDAVNWAD